MPLRQYFTVCSMTSTSCTLFMMYTPADIQTNANSNTKFLVRASFLEIYNERISDLMVRIVVTYVKYNCTCCH